MRDIAIMRLQDVVKFGLILLSSYCSVSQAEPVNAELLKSNWTSVLGGAATTVLMHELGHFLVAESEGAAAYFDGITIEYRDTDGSDQQALRLSSAGFQTQWLASEYGFMRLNQGGLSDRQRSWHAGLILGHIGITSAYLTFLKNHEDGDVGGVATASGLSTDKVVALLAIPAVIDSWRLFGKYSPKWASWTARGFKGLGVAAIWRF